MVRKDKRIPLIKTHGGMLVELSKCSTPSQKKMLQVAPNEVIHCIAECCHNLLKGNVPLTPAHKKALYPKRKHLRTLASKSVSIKKKRELLNQKGGVLPLLGLLGPALQLLTKL